MMEKHSCHDFDIDVDNGVIIYFPVNRSYCFEPPIDSEKLVEFYKTFIINNEACITKEDRKIVELLKRLVYRKIENTERLYFNPDRIGLNYCPYCGKKLPSTLDDEYFMCIEMDYGPEYVPIYADNYWSPRDNALFKSGLPEPKPLPDEFKSDEWWKKRGLQTEKGCMAFRRKYFKWSEQHPRDLLMH